jgi:hypothetical protein
MSKVTALDHLCELRVVEASGNPHVSHFTYRVERNTAETEPGR